MNPVVAAVFDGFDPTPRAGLLQLRSLIFDIATTIPVAVSEALRWGQPAYLTAPRVGTTLRLGVPKTGGFAIYAHCQTTVISDFAAAFPGMDRVEGTRAIQFDNASQIDPARHGLLIRAALTYHL